MKKTVIKRIMTLALAVSLCFSMSSCLFLGGDLFSDDENTIVNTEINEAGELIIHFKDGTVQNAGRIENNNTDITVEGSGGDVSSATAKGLMSAVSIKSNFVSKTNSYLPGFGIAGGSGNKYYACGSGVIYSIDSDKALIITNHHVVYDSSSKGKDGISEDIEVFLYGKEASQYAITAEYVGGSAYYDIAVLYAESAAFKSGTVKAAEFSSEDVSVGETAIAVGNPQGYGISASLGIVSVDSEYITVSEGGSSTRAIRVDTAVNSGNSGGGLYDAYGRLIGIVNAKIVDESVENIGYAIPSSVASAVADNIIKNCFNKDNRAVKRAMLGITLGSASISTVIGNDGNIEIIESVTVSSVERRSLSDGVLEAGDILLEASVGNRSVKINRSYHIIDLMLYAGVGDTVNIKVKRGGEIMTKSMTVTEASLADY